MTEMNNDAGTDDNARISGVLSAAVDELCESGVLDGLFERHADGCLLPSSCTLKEIVRLVRAILFPSFYESGRSSSASLAVNTRTIRYQTGVNVERLHTLLNSQVSADLCYGASRGAVGDSPSQQHTHYNNYKEEAEDISLRLISRLPEIRRILSTDVDAAYDGDPAAQSKGEIIACYPMVRALANYRVAHELLLLGVPTLPRIITEMAHSETGIDIHPGARIGEHFMIDHGTGVVIGETCVIGDNVKLYQGVTLGAKSFPLDAAGNPIKGIPRHPILEDDVIVYSNATILGRVTIGRGSVVGANVWITEDMRPESKIFKGEEHNTSINGRHK